MTQLKLWRLLNMRPVTVCVVALMAWVVIIWTATALHAGLYAAHVGGVF